MKRIRFTCTRFGGRGSKQPFSKPEVDKNILFWILVLLGAVIIALAITSCAVTEPYPFESIKRQPVNEKCKTFRNWWAETDIEFLDYVYRMIDGTTPRAIRIIRWDGADMGKDGRRGRIAMIVVYYDRQN